jgi:hypothetical protein
MELQRWDCVIDVFGVSYGGTLPSIVLACEETWLGLFAVAPPNPPALESADRPAERLCSLSITLGVDIARAGLIFFPFRLCVIRRALTDRTLRGQVLSYGKEGLLPDSWRST